MTEFDVEQWWAGLTDTERDLAQRHRDDDPLHAEVVRQLHADGVMVETRGWHWTSEVKDFLDGGCE